MTTKIPEGYTTITPTLNIDGAAEAIELYKNAFGARVEMRVDNPKGDGKVLHSCLLIGNSKIFVADLCPEMGSGSPSKSTFYLYVDDVDSAFAKAQKSGLAEKSVPQDMFYGDRTGVLTDKFGNTWCLATHVRDVSKDEMDKAMKQMSNKAA